MQNIFDMISEFNKLNNSELVLFTQKNKIGHLILKTILSEKKDDIFINNVKKLDFIYCSFSSIFKQGKKIDNCCYYDFTFSIKKEFFNNIIYTDKIFGQFLKFVADNNISNISDFVNITFPMIENLSNYANIQKLPYLEKKEYMSIKKAYVKFLYTHNFIDSIFEVNTYRDDTLLRFNIGKKHIYIRKEQDDFITCSNEIIPCLEIFQKKDYTNIDIDIQFMEILGILKNINSENMLKNAELL